MDLESFKGKYYLFNPEQFGNIFVFVDFGNVRPWAKDFWPKENKFRFCKEIDIAKLADVCNWINPKKKFFYYGHFKSRLDLFKNHPENIKSRNSIFRLDKARGCGFLVKTKEIKMVPHHDEDGLFVGKAPKCNFDVEIGRDMLRDFDKNGIENFILWSGDSDFADPICQLKEDNKDVSLFATAREVSSELNATKIPIFEIKKIREFICWPKEIPQSTKNKIERLA